MSYYAILGLSEGSSPDEIKKAYRKLAQQWHPDRNKDPQAEATFKRIKDAYERLSNEPHVAPSPPPPSSWYKPFGGYYDMACTIASTFSGAELPVPGRPWKIKVPIGCWAELGPVINLNPKRPDVTFQVKLTAKDPTGFYWIERLEGQDKYVLCCKLKVTAGEVLAGSQVSFKNANPEVKDITLNLDPANGTTFKVEHCGLEHKGMRDPLYVTLDVEFKGLADERFDVLRTLYTSTAEALQTYEVSSFRGLKRK